MARFRSMPGAQHAPEFGKFDGLSGILRFSDGQLQGPLGDLIGKIIDLFGPGSGTEIAPDPAVKRSLAAAIAASTSA